MATYTENYTLTIKAAAQYLLSAAPAGLRAHDVERLQAIIEGTDSHELANGYISLAWRRALVGGFNADADLHVEFARLYPAGGAANRWEDDAGNWWLLFEPAAKVSWPSYGTAAKQTHATTRARIALMQEVQALAEGLEAALAAALGGAPVAHMLCTKAQREESARAAAEKKAVEAREKCLNALRLALVHSGAVSGLRVGQERIAGISAPLHLPVADLKEVAAALAGGLKACEIKGRKYDIEVAAVGDHPQAAFAEATSKVCSLRVSRVA